MGGVYVVAFVVRCASDLLLCETVSTEHLQFSTMHECNQAATALVSLAQASDSSRVWMATCHYLLKEGDGQSVVEAQPQEWAMRPAWATAIPTTSARPNGP